MIRDETIHVGVIGAGRQGRALAEAGAAVDGVEVVAVAGRRRDPVETLARDIGAAAFGDPWALIGDAEVGAVIVACPTALHHDYAVAALDAGKHVFCEVPLATTVAQADAMIAAARRAGRVLMGGQVLRHVAAYRRLREMIAGGELGAVIAASSTRTGPPYWPHGGALAADHHGDVIQEMLAFDIDVFNWLFGRPDFVWGAGHQTGGAFDHVQVGLLYGETIVAAEAGAVMPRGSTFTTTLRATGQAGVIELDHRLPADAPIERRFELIRSDGTARPVEVDPIDPDIAQLETFRDAMREPASRDVPAEAARDTLDVCWRIDRALRTGPPT